MALDPTSLDDFPSTSSLYVEPFCTTSGYSGSKVPGMESVVACISGYVGDEKSDLIKLINSSGGFYVGSLRKGATTHLVCKKFSGKKHEMAKRFGIQIVNYRWFEDCVEAGKRLSEGPYTSLSGKDVGALCWKLPKQDFSLNGRLGSSKSDIVNNYISRNNVAGHDIFEKILHPKDSPKPHISVESIDSDHSDQDLDRLLHYSSKNRGKRKIKSLKNQKIRYKTPETCTKKRSSSRRTKGNDSSPRNTTSRQASEHLSVSDESDVDVWPIIQETHQSSSSSWKCLREKERCVPTAFSRRDCLSKKGKHPLLSNFDSISHRMEHKPVNHAIASGSSRDAIKVKDHRNDAESSCYPTLRVRECMDEFPTESSYSIAENIEETHVACTLVPSDIACVICHAEEIASTEGVLPCGHNFCYECIKQWASEVASKTPTCPLCKSPFDMITKREQIFSVDGQESSFEESVIVLGHHNLAENLASLNSGAGVLRPACIICGIGDTEELLLVCNGCGERSAHSFCLDPPLPPVPGTPWFCGRCSQRRRVDTSWWYQLHNLERLGD